MNHRIRSGRDDCWG